MKLTPIKWSPKHVLDVLNTSKTFLELQKHYKKIIVLIILLIVGYALRTLPFVLSLSKYESHNNLPSVILWAWERPEDLRFLNDDIGVAFLAQTIHLNGEHTQNAYRQQPLKVNPNTKLIAVTRIETDKPALNQTQHDEALRLILNTLKLKNISAIQIDFDAKVSQREFYRQLLTDLRAKLPNTVPLSITALASFCLGDPWIKNLPVDEAVPMIFRMGTDNDKIKTALNNGTDFSIKLCQHSYGIATDEPLTMTLNKTRRLYIFKSSPRGWTADDLKHLP